MENSEKVKKDLENFLYGSSIVSIYGQKQENPNRKNKTRADLIDTFEFVSELINSEDIVCLKKNEKLIEDIFNNATILENSCNWSSSFTNEISIHQWENLVILMVHCGYGDVRSNYFQMILKFDRLDYPQNNILQYAIEELDTSQKLITIKFDDWINDLFYHNIELRFDFFKRNNCFDIYSGDPYFEAFDVSFEKEIFVDSKQDQYNPEFLKELKEKIEG